MAAHHLQTASLSPDGRVVFAINYPQTEKHPEGWAQGCFLNAQTYDRLGDYFFLPETIADHARPGSRYFDAHRVFSYCWSDDSSQLAICYHLRRWGKIFAFRKEGSAFRTLKMPELGRPFETKIAAALARSSTTSFAAEKWTPSGELVATISREVQMTDTGTPNRDWQNATLTFTIAFSPDGSAAVVRTEFRTVDSGP